MADLFHYTMYGVIVHLIWKLSPTHALLILGCYVLRTVGDYLYAKQKEAAYTKLLNMLNKEDK